MRHRNAVVRRVKHANTLTMLAATVPSPSPSSSSSPLSWVCAAAMWASSVRATVPLTSSRLIVCAHTDSIKSCAMMARVGGSSRSNKLATEFIADNSWGNPHDSKARRRLHRLDATYGHMTQHCNTALVLCYALDRRTWSLNRSREEVKDLVIAVASRDRDSNANDDNVAVTSRPDAPSASSGAYLSVTMVSTNAEGVMGGASTAVRTEWTKVVKTTTSPPAVHCRAVGSTNPCSSPATWLSVLSLHTFSATEGWVGTHKHTPTHTVTQTVTPPHMRNHTHDTGTFHTTSCQSDLRRFDGVEPQRRQEQRLAVGQGDDECIGGVDGLWARGGA